MLQNVKDIALYVVSQLRYSIFIIFFSVFFSQYFISPQRPFYDFLKWDEIHNPQILVPKVGPFINSLTQSTVITSFYFSDSISMNTIRNDLYTELSFNNIDGSRIRLYGTARIRLNEKISIQNEFEFDNNGEDDAHFHGSKRSSGRGWVGYLQHSSLNYLFSNGHLSIGRGNPFFININESLLINSDFPPVEYIWWHHSTDWFQYDWGVLLMDEINTLNRFLTFHRYGINMMNWRLGFTEAVLGIYTDLGSAEIGYFTPAAVLLETEENRGINANLLWLIDGIYKWNNWTFYGEFLIDDFALDGNSPPQVAALLGIGKKINNLLLNFEYSRINRWTGNHCNFNYIWTEQDVVMGHSMGSDAHQLLISSYLQINKRISSDILVKLLEHGEGTALDRLHDWPDAVPCDINFGYRSEPFPSSSNTTYIGEIQINYLLKPNILLRFKIDCEINQQSSGNINISYKL